MTCPETSWARIVRGLIAGTPTVYGPLVDLTDIESMDRATRAIRTVG